MDALNKSQIVTLLKQNSGELEKFGVHRIGVFGSFVRGEQNTQSDIDLVVEFNKGQKNSAISWERLTLQKAC